MKNPIFAQNLVFLSLFSFTMELDLSSQYLDITILNTFNDGENIDIALCCLKNISEKLKFLIFTNIFPESLEQACIYWLIITSVHCNV